MVDADVRRSGMGIADNLMDFDVFPAAAQAFLTLGGLFAAQEVTDQLMPMLGFPTDPTSPADLGVNALLKVIGGIVTVMLASRVGGRSATWLGGYLALGMLMSAGLDAFDVLQRGGLPGLAPANNSGSSAPSPSAAPSPPQNPQPAAPQPSRPARSPSADAGAFR